MYYYVLIGYATKKLKYYNQLISYTVITHFYSYFSALKVALNNNDNDK